MKIITNNKKIERNIKLSKYTLYISLAFLAFGFIWSIRHTDPQDTYIGWLILVPSYFLVQISIYLSNKWNKSPRPDEAVIQSLKGLKDDYTLYNFTTSVDHLLIGPTGIWVINPYHHRGTIVYDADKEKYTQQGGPGFLSKYFGQEALPNIVRDVNGLKRDIAIYLKEKSISSYENVNVINLFFGEDVEIKGNNHPELTIKSDKLKDYLRKHAKNMLSEDQVKEINKKIQKEVQ